jgi:hypothetical protein
MEVFWITAWKPLATAKLAMKSILKPGKKPNSHPSPRKAVEQKS